MLKKGNHLYSLAFAMLVSACASSFDADESAELTMGDIDTVGDSVFWGQQGAYENYDQLRRPLDVTKLHRLAQTPHRRDSHELSKLINRAAAEKNPEFRELLTREDLRKFPNVRLALSNYDYSLNGNQASLEWILNAPGYSVSGKLGTLAFTDEWTESIKFVSEAEKGVDGGRGLALGMFWITREQLFPENYHRHKNRDDIRPLIEKRLDEKVRAKLDRR